MRQQASGRIHEHSQRAHLGIVTLAALACLMLLPPPAATPGPGKLLSLGVSVCPIWSTPHSGATMTCRCDWPSARPVSKFTGTGKPGKGRESVAGEAGVVVGYHVPLCLILLSSRFCRSFFLIPHMSPRFWPVSPPALAVGSVCLSWLQSLRITSCSLILANADKERHVMNGNLGP